jgi:hypothetical protein
VKLAMAVPTVRFCAVVSAVALRERPPSTPEFPPPHADNNNTVTSNASAIPLNLVFNAILNLLISFYKAPCLKELAPNEEKMLRLHLSTIRE